MPMSRYSPALFLSSLVAWTLVLSAPQPEVIGDEGTDRPAEFKVLERFVGSWDTEAISRRAEWTPKETRITGTTKMEWVLGGRFVQSNGHSDPGGLQDIQMMTYDAGRKHYRHWHFDSQGNGSDISASGQWDEAAKTLTWKTELADGISMTNKVQFLDKDTCKWVLVAKDKGGKVYLDMEGKLTRSK